MGFYVFLVLPIYLIFLIIYLILASANLPLKALLNINFIQKTIQNTEPFFGSLIWLILDKFDIVHFHYVKIYGYISFWYGLIVLYQNITEASLIWCIFTMSNVCLRYRFFDIVIFHYVKSWQIWYGAFSLYQNWLKRIMLI